MRSTATPTAPEAAVLDERTPAADAPMICWPADLGLVLVDAEPTLFALYQRDSDDDGGEPVSGAVIAWVMVPSEAEALLVFVDRPDERPVLTTLASVRRRWAPLLDAELVEVAGPRTLRRAA